MLGTALKNTKRRLCLDAKNDKFHPMRHRHEWETATPVGSGRATTSYLLQSMRVTRIDMRQYISANKTPQKEAQPPNGVKHTCIPRGHSRGSSAKVVGAFTAYFTASLSIEMCAYRARHHYLRCGPKKSPATRILQGRSLRIRTGYIPRVFVMRYTPRAECTNTRTHFEKTPEKGRRRRASFRWTTLGA